MPKIRGIKPDYWTDEDVVDLSIPARLLFIGLWTFACDNGHLQDKPKQIKMRIFPGDDVSAADLLRELAGSGRIVRGGGWITIPNLTEHQRPDRRYFTTCDKEGCEDPPEKVSQRRARRAHTVHTEGAQGVHDGGTECAHVDGEGEGDGEGDGEGMVKVNDDADASSGAALALVDDRPDVDRVCARLADRIEANGSRRPTITKAWRDAARLMLDRDERTETEVLGAIDWCQADDFWRGNVLSMPKLREKYDQLRLQAQRRPTTSSRATEQQDLLDRAMARAEARERSGT